MNKISQAGLALAMAVIGGPATSAYAMDSAMGTESRPYLTGGYEYIVRDDNRRSIDGDGAWFGGGFAINDYFGLETTGFYHTFDADRVDVITGLPGGVSWREWGGEVDGMLFFTRDSRFSPYVDAGVGIVKTEAQRFALRGDSLNTYYTAGVGFMSFFEPTHTIGLRVDVRYRSFEPDSLDGVGRLNEPIGRVGFVIPITQQKRIVTTTTETTTGGGAMSDSTTMGDADHDGVPDNLDKCPGTAAGVAVDANGCPVTAPVTGASRNFENVNFAFDRSDITDYGKSILDNAANVINGLVPKYPALKVDVSGHTDYIGTDAYNQGLSERRANAVKAYLQRKGVDGSHINTFAYGETRPIAPNETDEGRALNRRAELRTHE